MEVAEAGVRRHTLDSVHASADRPRQRLLDGGAGLLETEDLLAIVVQCDDADRRSLPRLAQLIDRGQLAIGGDWPAHVAVNTDAIATLAAALELARRAAEAPAPDAIRGPDDVAAIVRRDLGGLRRERVLVVVCDASNRPLRTVVVSDGASDHALIPVREILHAVLRWDGRAFAVAHNHPCGDAEPSDTDVAATRRIADAARIVGLRFLGHVVVGGVPWCQRLCQGGELAVENGRHYGGGSRG